MSIIRFILFATNEKAEVKVLILYWIVVLCLGATLLLVKRVKSKYLGLLL